MVNITVEDIQQISDENLQDLIDTCIEEKTRRNRLARVKLIEDFHKAWNALKTARINIRYYTDDEEYTRLTDWDEFDFE